MEVKAVHFVRSKSACRTDLAYFGEDMESIVFELIFEAALGGLSD